ATKALKLSQKMLHIFVPTKLLKSLKNLPGWMRINRLPQPLGASREPSKSQQVQTRLGTIDPKRVEQFLLVYGGFSPREKGQKFAHQRKTHQKIRAARQRQ